jgi:hypothetical protein
MSLPDQTIDTLFAGVPLITVGEIVRVSGARTVSLAQANSSANLRGTLGVSQSGRAGTGGPVVVVTAGRARIRCVTGLTLAAGDTLYVSASQAGAATNVKPANAFPVGTVEDSTGYATANPYVTGNIARVSELPSAAGVDFLFQTVADMSTFDMTGQANGVVAEVASLKRTFVYSPASTATLDPVNYTAVAASPAGRWLDSGDSHLAWLIQNGAAWYIDAQAGNNENTGAVGFPIQTWAEFYKRTHGLVMPEGIGGITINFTGQAPDSDPTIIAILGTDQSLFRYIQINCTRTSVLTGTVTAKTDFNASAGGGGQQANFTAAVADWTASLRRYVRFTTGAGAFKATAWIESDLGGGTAQISSPSSEDGAGSVVNEATIDIGDTWNVYTFAKLSGLYVTQPGMFLWMVNPEFDNANGFVQFDVGLSPENGVQIYGGAVRRQIYGGLNNVLFQNSYARMEGTSGPVDGFYQMGLYDNAGGTSQQAFFGGSNFKRYPLFSGVSPFVVDSIATDGNTTQTISIIKSAAGNPMLTVGGKTNLSFSNVIGNGNLGKGIVFSRDTVGTTSYLKIESINAVVAGNEVEMSTADRSAPIIAKFVDVTITDIKDPAGNHFVGSAGEIVGSVAQFTNPGGSDIPVGRVVRANGTAAQAVQAQADSVADTGRVHGVTVTTVPAGGLGLMALPGGAVIEHDGAVVFTNASYLSTGTLGDATTTLPAAAGTNQKLRLGTPVRTITGNYALVSFRPEIVSVAADGAA